MGSEICYHNCYLYFCLFCSYFHKKKLLSQLSSFLLLVCSQSHTFFKNFEVVGNNTTSHSFQIYFYMFCNQSYLFPKSSEIVESKICNYISLYFCIQYTQSHTFSSLSAYFEVNLIHCQYYFYLFCCQSHTIFKNLFVWE